MATINRAQALLTVAWQKCRRHKGQKPGKEGATMWSSLWNIFKIVFGALLVVAMIAGFAAGACGCASERPAYLDGAQAAAASSAMAAGVASAQIAANQPGAPKPDEPGLYDRSRAYGGRKVAGVKEVIAPPAYTLTQLLALALLRVGLVVPPFLILGAIPGVFFKRGDEHWELIGEGLGFLVWGLLLTFVPVPWMPTSGSCAWHLDQIFHAGNFWWGERFWTGAVLLLPGAIIFVAGCLKVKEGGWKVIVAWGPAIVLALVTLLGIALIGVSILLRGSIIVATIIVIVAGRWLLRKMFEPSAPTIVVTPTTTH